MTSTLPPNFCKVKFGYNGGGHVVLSHSSSGTSCIPSTYRADTSQIYSNPDNAKLIGEF